MKLLSKTFRTYLLCSVLIIAVGVPVLYLLLNDVIGRETSELIMVQQNKLLDEFLDINSEQELKYFLNLKKELKLKLIPAGYRIVNPIYRIDEFDRTSGESVPYTVCRFKASILSRLYLVEFRMSLLTEKALIKTILKAQLFVVILLLSGLFVVNKSVSRKIWEPFHNTLIKLKEHEVKHSPYINLPSSEITEFELLNKAIFQLVQKNHKDFVAQKEFTENAAHEMQTPLAILHSKLELLIQSEELKEEQAELIDTMLAMCNRLSRLNLSLLLLARIENDQFLEKESLRIAPIISKVLKDFSEQFASRRINVDLNSTSTTCINANSTLLEILISNLVSNAVKYNVDEGSIMVNCKEGKIVFTNTGDPVILDAEKIYKRFSKSNTHQKSMGLGLAIVKSICEINGYEIEYSFSPLQSEHTFELTLG